MERRVFVARDWALRQLNGFLDRALAGQGQVCFVTGEAGSGKTALVTEFARRTQEKHEELVVSVGQSDAQTGAGDPYLPFREVLGQLTGDVEAKLARGAISSENAGRLRKLLVLSGEALVEVGPELVGIFVPGAGLATRVAAFAAEKVGWLDKLERLAVRPREGDVLASSGIKQEHILEQYTNVLHRLAEKKPLLLVLDDLQWVDTASTNLLFRLGRRIGGSRILMVGTYRPEEVALGRGGERHPLAKVVAEFKRYYGEISVDLDRAKETEGRRFVDAFLETEVNRLGEGFREALYHRTEGHPLFTIELLRNMQERGDLVRDEDGCWVEGPVLDWGDLPDRVEGVIEERIGRLEEEMCEALRVGSVEGEDFTAEVVASVQATDARGLIRRLSGELEKQHRLVSARGVRRTNGQRLSLYRFQHNLFQKYLYNELSEAERAYLHEDVGCVLEALYGEQAYEIAVQLARHFEEAGVEEKARYYLRRAGEQAAARFANDEAVDYFSRALELMPEDDTPKWATERYTLLLAREEVYDVMGQREAQAGDLAALEGLATAMHDDARRCEVALLKAGYSRRIGDHAAADEAAQTAISWAKSAQDVGKEAEGYLLSAAALVNQGHLEQSRLQAEKGLLTARATRQRRVEAQCLHILGIIVFCQGDFGMASTYEREAVTIGQELNSHREILPSLNQLAGIAAAQGDFAESRAYCEQALRTGRQIGDRRVEAVLLSNLGELSLVQGDYTGAEFSLEQALTLYGDVADRRGMGDVLAHKGLVSHHLGDDEAARSFSQQALSIVQEIGNRLTEAYAMTNLGHALAGLGDLVDAAGAYERSLEILDELGQESQAMEALAGLARVSLAGGYPLQATVHVERILKHLESKTLDGATDPGRVYLTCYRILRALEDPRAEEILVSAHNMLQERAKKIGDGTMRQSFLENVPAHREIAHEFIKGQQAARQAGEGAS